MRKKNIRFEDNQKRMNILEPGKPLFGQIYGRWKQEYFGNKNPIVLEIGCGRGDYTVGLAREFPKKNFIGMDMKGDRIWFGACVGEEEDLKYVGFIRSRIELVHDFFSADEVGEIWITFPGPRPRKGEANRRLTTPKFLELYKTILKKDGIIHVKTDSDFVYEYTQEVLDVRNDTEILARTTDLYGSKFVGVHHGIKTHFEKRYLAQGKKIKYMAFRFK